MTPVTSTPANVKLSDNQKKIVDTLRSMGALNEEKARSAEDVMKLTKMPKGRVLSIVQELEKLRLIERARSHKQHKYYLRA